MPHCYYVCDKENWTCFELGKHCPDETRELMSMVVEGCIFDVEEFNLLGDSLQHFSIFDKDKREALYYYLSNVKPENYEFCYHEDYLIEEVFRCQDYNWKKPIHQVNSLYSNCSEYTFIKQWVQKS